MDCESCQSTPHLCSSNRLHFGANSIRARGPGAKTPLILCFILCFVVEPLSIRYNIYLLKKMHLCVVAQRNK